MRSILKIKRSQKLLIILLTVVVVLIAGYFAFHGTNYFSRRGIRQLSSSLQPFGLLSPIIIILLIFLSTVIPPLPLPIPLLELAAGVMFGFVGGALVVWLSQIGSSVLAFYITRFLKKKFLGMGLLENRRWDFYRSYLNQKGALAIFLIRFTMAAPFNIISYLAGLTQISLFDFTVATTLGTIPESLLYSFLGSQIRTLHIRLFYLSMLVILVGSVGFIFTLVFMLLLKPKK